MAKKIIKKTSTIKAKKTVKKIAKKITPKKKAPTKKVLKKTKTSSPQNNSTKSAKRKGYGARDLAYFKKIIIEKKKEIIEELQTLKETMMDVTTGEYSNEGSNYSMHMEQGTDAMEREKTFLFASREGKFLNYLEDALRRIENGTYGICIDCIEEPKKYCRTCPLIPKKRLEAVPHAQMCIECKLRKGQ